MRSIEDAIPDLRDGLTRPERMVLHVLNELKKERGDRMFSTAEIYGRVSEHVTIAPETFQAILVRLGARGSR